MNRSVINDKCSYMVNTQSNLIKESYKKPRKIGKTKNNKENFELDLKMLFKKRESEKEMLEQWRNIDKKVNMI